MSDPAARQALSRRRRVPAAWRWAAPLVVGTLVVVSVDPGRVGLADDVPFAQLVPFRMVMALGWLALATLVGVGGFAASRRPPAVGRARRRPAIVLLVPVLLLGAGGNLAILTQRGHAQVEPVIGGPTELRVLSFNTLDAVGPPQLAALVTRWRPHVVVLAETSLSTAESLAALLRDAGDDMQVIAVPDVETFPAPTILLVSTALGPYELDEAAPSGTGSFRAEPVTPDGGPTIVAVHAGAPMGGRFMASWRSGLRWALGQCATPASADGIILAGDFNATTDHPGLAHPGPCVDAAVQVGAGAVGTWPASVPTWLSAPIDHVLAGPTLHVSSFTVLDAERGADHRPVLAVLSR